MNRLLCTSTAYGGDVTSPHYYRLSSVTYTKLPGIFMQPLNNTKLVYLNYGKAQFNQHIIYSSSV